MRRLVLALLLPACGPSGSGHFAQAWEARFPATLLDAIALPDASVAVLTWDGQAIAVAAISPEGETRWWSRPLAEPEDDSVAFGQLRADAHGNLFAGGWFTDPFAPDTSFPWLARVAADGSDSVTASADLPAMFFSLAPAADAMVVSGWTDDPGCAAEGGLLAYDADLSLTSCRPVPEFCCFDSLTRVGDDLWGMTPQHAYPGPVPQVFRLVGGGIDLASEIVEERTLGEGDEPGALVPVDEGAVLAGGSFDALWIEALEPDLSTRWRDEISRDQGGWIAGAFDREAGHVTFVHHDDTGSNLRARVHDAESGTLVADEHLDRWLHSEYFRAVVTTDGALWVVATPWWPSGGSNDAPISRFTTAAAR